MTTIPLKQQIINRLLADATLSGVLGDGGESIYPQAGQHPDQDSATPFLVLRIGAETPTSNLTARQFLTFWVYDNPLQGYWDVDAIIARLRSRLDGYEFAYDGRYWLRCEYDGASEEQTDEAWNKAMKFVRFSIPRV